MEQCPVSVVEQEVLEDAAGREGGQRGLEGDPQVHAYFGVAVDVVAGDEVVFVGGDELGVELVVGELDGGVVGQ